MQIVFLNTFEKAAEIGGIEGAQLSICEESGLWSVLWLEDRDGQKGKASPERWFEGTSWEEMMAAFRHGIARMMGKGYFPVVDGMLERERNAGGSFYSMLQCYGEQHANEELFQALREWRRKVAAAEKKSAYLIATNRMLWMISAFVPWNEEELRQIPGWGAARHEAYGSDILTVTQGVERAAAFPLDWVPEKLDPSFYRAWLYKQKENKYKSLMESQQEKKKILSILHEEGGLDRIQAELSLSRRELLLRIEQLEQEGYDLDPLIERELSAVPDEERKQIWTALEAVGDRYLKPVLQQVYGEAALDEADRSVEQLYERLRLMRMSYRRSGQGKAV
ncbi:HRDC domain-containing protein [Paenibacillus sp. GCM10027627]|uniref:HRDC domain-containing protein n=1 Tax=unclassified Paenibacillus TaxID=185978 RepID=UPI00362E0907